MNFITKYFKKHKITTYLDPIVVEYTNPTVKKLTAIMFGFNDFHHENNFGNGELMVKNLQTSDNGYNRVICQSAFKPVVFTRLRVQSSTIRMLHKTIYINRKYANGIETKTPINLSLYQDAYQFQNEIIDIKRKESSIDGNTFFEFEIDPNTSFVICIYPEESRLVSYKKYKQHLLKNATINNRNTVIIQSTGATILNNFIKKIGLLFTNLKKQKHEKLLKTKP